jgi:hypothetical protein
MGGAQLKHFGKQKNLLPCQGIKPQIILPTALQLLED